LIVYGDSGYDTGNLNALATGLGLSPLFDDPIYAGGGNKKASDGYTLIEGFLLGLGVPDAPGSILDLESIDIAADGIDFNLPITNFAVAGASSGDFGVFTTVGIDLSKVPIGLQSQIDLSLDYVSQLTFLGSDVDVAIGIGNNDIAAIVAGENAPRTIHVLSTKTKADDNALIDSVVQTIADNITGAVQTLKSAGVDEITILGPQLVGLTPYAQSLDQINGLDISGFFNRISTRANKELTRIFNNTHQAAPSIQDPDVYFISGSELNTRLLKTTEPGFVDLVHLDSDTAVTIGAFMASLVVQNSGFDSFGFA
jgi:phospholipase/lecithinase/hemolysin